MKMITLSKWQIEILREAFAMLAERDQTSTESRQMKGYTGPTSDRDDRQLAAEGLAEDSPALKGVMTFAA